MSPGHQSVDVLFEMPIGQLGVEIEQIGIGFNAIDAACAYQAGEACPTPGCVIVTGKKRVTARHGGTSDCIFD